MGELMLVYSYTGHTLKEAEARAKASGADLVRVWDEKRPSIFGALLRHCPRGMRGVGTPIQPLGVDWAKYDHITLCVPIWGGKPASAMVTAAAEIPAGKKVDILAFSGGGNGNLSALAGMLKGQGCTVQGAQVSREST